MTQWYGGIEGGGTKFVCAVASGPDNIRAQTRFDTTTPDETIARAVSFFRQQQQEVELEAIGIGSFGPIDLDPASQSYGYITTTPKLDWTNTDLAGSIQSALQLPVGIDTDVNAAAFGEYHWGAAQDLDSFVYFTIGTGIGGGGMLGGKLIHGLIHPEMGHILVPHDWQRDPFPGICPYHGDCLEGLASGTAIAARWGTRGQELPDDHEAWPLEADYIARAFVNVITILSPQRIILGGGVMAQQRLYPLVRRRVQTLLNGYVQSPAIVDNIDEYIVPPRLGGRAGVLGAIALAQQAA